MKSMVAMCSAQVGYFSDMTTKPFHETPDFFHFFLLLYQIFLYKYIKLATRQSNGFRHS